MTDHSFDTIINRRGTNSLKYDFNAAFKKPADLLPLWVADMDFKTPQAVVDALTARAAHGIYGYSMPDESYYTALTHWYKARFHWTLEKEWVIQTPGVVFAIANAIRSFTNVGDAVLIQQPVYYPFGQSVLKNNRTLVNNPLELKDGHYHINLVDFEAKIIDNQVKLFILCSPHNPVGRVWTAQELKAMADICKKHQVLIVSDEIHSDFVYPGHTHQVLTALDASYDDFVITCTAPSKTFNLAGLQISNIVIPNPSLRKTFRATLNATGFGEPGIMAIAACEAAYAQGGPWLDDLLVYLAQNIAWCRDFVAANLPQVKVIEPQGTYLLWLDFRALGLTPKALDTLMVEDAKLWLDDGVLFGPEGAGFQRFNIACPRATLEQAFGQLKAAVDQLNSARK